jgi:hypothetical protein
VSAAIEDRGGLIVGYLNITPRQPPETTSSWGAFRVAHNRDEGNRDVRLQASARGVRLRDGRGSCVRDSYTTVTRVRYTEIACLLAGPRRSSVIVAAASAAAWARLSPTLERALGSAIT